MHVVVLGGGVVGVATAYYLARDGARVTLVERRAGPAEGASYANAGELCMGSATPWPAPGVPLAAAGWLLTGGGPLAIRLAADPSPWPWLARFLRQCTATRHRENRERLLRLAVYSHRCLEALRGETAIDYDQGRGILQLYRSRRRLAAAQAQLAPLDRLGIRYRRLDMEQCLEHEPGLARARGGFAGGIRLGADETGDCRLFTCALAARAESLGLSPLYGTEVHGLRSGGGRVAAAETGRGPITADAYVLALGTGSRRPLEALGIRLPIYPVKGYSVTMPVRDPGGAPVAAVMDAERRIAVTRLGARIRAGGMAELEGEDASLRPERAARVLSAVQELFPAGGDPAQATYWSGLRPMLPDGPPVLGATPFRNLYLNTGHGSLGWSLACGSARVVADLVMGREPEIALDGLTAGRFGIG